MKKILFLIILSVLFIDAQAQDKKVLDSLMKVYHQAKHDTTKINVIFEVMELYHKKVDTVVTLAQKTLQWSEKIDYDKGKGYSLYYLGVAYYDKNNYPQSLEYYKKSKSFLESAKDNTQLISVFNNMAIIYDSQGYYATALEYYQQALSISEKLQSKYNMATCLTNIGNVYKNLGNYPLAIEHYLNGLKIFEELKSKRSIAYIYNNIGIVYLNQKNMAFAQEYFFKSLEMREKLNDKKGMASCFNNIGNLYLQHGKLQEALAQYQKSLSLYEEINDIRGRAISLNNIGDIQNQLLKHKQASEYYKKGLELNEGLKNKWGMTYSLIGLARAELGLKQYDKGIEYATKSLDIAKEIKGLVEMKNAYRNLFVLHKKKEDYVKALEYHQYFTEMQDSILNEQNTKIIANLEAKVEIERKQKEIEILNKNKQLDEKTKETLQKDLKLQQIEAERQLNARLTIEKQAEADQLLAQARQEKDKHKQDSLHALSQKIQLEADNLKIKEKQLQAEGKARELEIIKEKEARKFQLYLLYLASFACLVVTILAYFIFLAQQKEKKARELITEQKEEIAQQKEEINQQRDFLALQAQELETANQTKDKLFAVLGHDLRSPIGSLEGTLNLMNLGMVSYDEFQHFVPQFHKNVKNMQNTLENLLQWSVTQMQGMNVNPSHIHISELIEEKVQLFTEVAKAKNITVSTEVDADIMAWADVNHVRLLLRNLLNNAIKFTPSEGHIRILAYPQEAQVIISVIDTGVGISEEMVGKLFQKNQTFTTYGTNGEKGTGLGLQLCQEIVTKNNGTIWASSEQGKGSTFSFSLPIA
ncbi:MAG: tetratricopeptide repeat protein [Bacteroidetes bacterium]|nr:MAG: tetratricopeptide repeat protein [Bacteroidota bacterium]